MTGRESIPFVLKGPVSVQVIDHTATDTGRKTGCAVIDLRFPNPSQVGELVFSNYYTAWMSIYVKRLPVKGTAATSGKPGNSGATGRARPQFERSISVDLSGGNDFRNKVSTHVDADGGKTGDLFVLESLHSTNLNMSSRRRHSSGPNSGEISDRPWECCIPMKTLMHCSHYEAGCQESFSIPATESLVEWKDVVIMRLVLYQPSTVWKMFSVEDVNVYKNLPKRGCTQADDNCRQREGWLATLRLHTKKMLGGQLVEPEKYESDEDGDP